MNETEYTAPHVSDVVAEALVREHADRHIVGGEVVEDQVFGDQIVGAGVLAIIDSAESSSS